MNSLRAGAAMACFVWILRTGLGNLNVVDKDQIA